MPDWRQFIQVVALAALVAAVVVLPCRWWRRGTAAAGVLGVGLGFAAGCWLLEVRPHWPPREDLDRLLLIVLPAIVLVELLAAFPGWLAWLLRPVVKQERAVTAGASGERWLAWLLRLAVAAGAAYVLLYNSSYVAELAGPGSRTWSPAQTVLVLAGLAAALAAAWTALSVRGPGPTVPLALAVACAGAALTIMLSAYATGGPLGLPLAGALTGVALAALALRGSPDLVGAIGVGVVGLYALLVVGRYFGELTTLNAGLLLLAPVLGRVPELPYLRRLKPPWRGVLGVALTVVPVVVALALARQKFEEDSGRTAPGTHYEESPEDYQDDAP